MANDITAEKAREYQEVAGLLCIDIDMLSDLAAMPDVTYERLRLGIERLKEKKDQVITDAETRERRYAACEALYSLPRGAIRSDRIG
jgi:hypothetical protein